MELVLASSNQGKLAEIRAICAPWGIQVVTAASLGFTQDVPETGDTFEDNARLKAVAVSQALNRPALADDSGLVVEALNGAPGVHSARYAGEHGDDAANSAKLLTEMDRRASRKAGRGLCLCYALPSAGRGRAGGQGPPGGAHRPGPGRA